MIPTMTLETYLAGWGAVDRDRQAVAREILKLCSAMRRTVSGEAGGLLAHRLAVALRNENVAEVSVDDAVSHVEGACGRHTVSLTRSPCGSATFTITSADAASGRHRPMLASGRLSLDAAFQVMLNVGKGTHIFAQNSTGSTLRLQSAGAASANTGPLAA